MIDSCTTPSPHSLKTGSLFEIEQSYSGVASTNQSFSTDPQKVMQKVQLGGQAAQKGQPQISLTFARIRKELYPMAAAASGQQSQDPSSKESLSRQLYPAVPHILTPAQRGSTQTHDCSQQSPPSQSHAAMLVRSSQSLQTKEKETASIDDSHAVQNDEGNGRTSALTGGNHMILIALRPISWHPTATATTTPNTAYRCNIHCTCRPKLQHSDRKRTRCVGWQRCARQGCSCLGRPRCCTRCTCG